MTNLLLAQAEQSASGGVVRIHRRLESTIAIAHNDRDVERVRRPQVMSGGTR
jgi:hypothetical protein